ncbi:MAG: VCBS repeat-containing protein [Bacteroidales bacterium]|nr:VCBS repeat-containing protein [Bacteroidales bacterium]
MMKTDKIIYLIAVVAVSASCGKVARPQEKPLEEPEPVVTESNLESGVPLKSEGISALNLSLCRESRVIGYSYTPGAPSYDLWLLGRDAAGKQWWSGCDCGVVKCSVSSNESSELVYGNPVHFDGPWAEDETLLRIVQYGEDIYALHFSADRSEIEVSRIQEDRFVPGGYTLTVGSPEGSPVAFDATMVSADVLEINLLCRKEASYTPEIDRDESLYNSAGIYKGEFPGSVIYRMRVSLPSWTPSSPMAKVCGDDTVLAEGISYFKDVSCGAEGLLLVNKFGCLKFLPYGDETSGRYVRFNDGSVLMNTSESWSLLSVGTPADRSLCFDVIIAGSAAVNVYRSAGIKDTDGTPLFHLPGFAPACTPRLYAGNSACPCVTDWDGDGVLDIVEGNEDGFLLWFKNYGTDENPVFKKAEAVTDGSAPICIKPGYYNVGGPAMAAAGYLGQTVCDWNSDGIPDIVFSSIEGKGEVMCGRRTADGTVILGGRHALMHLGMELYSAPRVRPAARNIGGTVYIVIADADDAAHMYMKSGNYNVTDRGKLRLDDGKFIYNHITDYAHKSLWGRVRYAFADWDGDGDQDLLVGTAADSSIPSCEYGTPYRRSRASLGVVWLENTGTDAQPSYAYPRQFVFRGLDFAMGDGIATPEACNLGGVSAKGCNLLVGAPSGELVFMRRSDLMELTLWK